MAPGFGAFSRRRRVIVPILTPFARFTANAPVSRCLVFACAGATIATSMLQCIGLLSLDLRATFARGQLWRLVTSQVAFSTPAELVFGAFLLHTFREFERRFKTSKFAVAVLVLWAVATALQVIFLATGIASRVAPGPYSLIFGLFVHYFSDIPRSHKGAFLCIPLTDKSFTYMWGLQLACCDLNASGWAAASGLLAGAIYRCSCLPLRNLRLPVGLQRFCVRVCGCFGASRRRRRRDRLGAYQQVGQMDLNQPQQLFGPPPVVAAAEADPGLVERLVEMGYPEEQARLALRRAGNDAAAAVSILGEGLF